MIESAKIVTDVNSVLAKDCAICDEPFEIRDMYDTRIICPRCKGVLKTIINQNTKRIEVEDAPYSAYNKDGTIKMNLC